MLNISQILTHSSVSALSDIKTSPSSPAKSSRSLDMMEETRRVTRDFSMYPDTATDDSASDADILDSPKKKASGISKIFSQTSFDTYFLQSASSSKTSSNVFSTLVAPLTPDEYALAMNTHWPAPPPIKVRPVASFPRFFRELQEGFNLLFYGLGSKRTTLNRFATEFCAKSGHVVVVNAFQPNFALKDLISSIENVPGVSSLPLLSSGIEPQTRRIHDFFSQETYHLYIIIHNIDSPALCTLKAKSCISLLAHNPNIHIIASIDHINAPLIWSTTEISARKQESGYSSGYAWLWHDLTTLMPYDTELIHADRSSISGAHHSGSWGTQDTGSVALPAMMTDTAAQHILASVTQRAKKLFVLMASKQLERMEADTNASNELQSFAISYDMLFNAARDNFIATNDTALKALLGEFRDHGLILGAAGSTVGVGEVLWIPLRKERMAKILQSLKESL